MIAERSRLSFSQGGVRMPPYSVMQPPKLAGQLAVNLQDFLISGFSLKNLDFYIQSTGFFLLNPLKI